MQRDTYIDSIKTILIFFVVLTHCLARLGTGSVDEYIVMDFQYTFNMPLFVFVSGYLFNTSKPWDKVLLGGAELLVAYSLFQVIWMILNHTPMEVRNFFLPQFSLWYLLSLFFWRIILKSFSCVSRNKYAWFVVSIIISLCCGFIPLGKEMSFQRTFSFLPFFIMGFLCRGTAILDNIRGIDKRITIGIVFIFVIVSFYVGKPPYWLLCGRTSYYDFHCNLVLSPFIKLCWYFIAVVLSACFLNLIGDREQFSKHGSKTLTVYLLHYFPIWLLRHLGYRTESLLLLTCLSFAIFVVLIYIHRFYIIEWITNPLSLCRRK